MTTESTNEVSAPKQPKIRANSRMALIVEQFKAGNTTIDGLASSLQQAEEAGLITGLKKTSDEFKATKNTNFYKKVVNWYLNQAKHKKFVDAPITPRKVKAKKELVKEVVAAAETAVTESSTADILPSI